MAACQQPAVVCLVVVNTDSWYTAKLLRGALSAACFAESELDAGCIMEHASACDAYQPFPSSSITSLCGGVASCHSRLLSACTTVLLDKYRTCLQVALDLTGATCQ
jgi:hypothetical protein